jgi:hypothetical protein
VQKRHSHPLNVSSTYEYVTAYLVLLSSPRILNWSWLLQLNFNHFTGPKQCSITVPGYATTTHLK